MVVQAVTSIPCPRMFAYFAWLYGLQTSGGAFLPSTNPYRWGVPT